MSAAVPEETTSAGQEKHIFLIAGEPSGDLLGARLMAALKRRHHGSLRFSGIGGPLMAAEGLQSLYPLADFAVMGLVEVLPHIRRIRERISATVARILAEQPDVLVTIDSPGFSLRVSRQIKGRGPALVHYVAPSVWAWKPGRAKKVAGYLDCLLTLLPFEPPYFEAHGLRAVFVGHPAVEALPEAKGTGVDKADEAPLLCLLPGSRRGEVGRLLPIFREAVARLQPRFPDLHCVLPTVPTVAGRVREEVSDWPVPIEVVEGADAKVKAFRSAHVALAASGTVAVELAVAGVPAVIAYRTSPVTAWIVRRLVKVRFASLPNLLLDRELQPELLQSDCTPEGLLAALTPLMEDTDARAAQIAGYREVVAQLTPADGGRPSDLAAEEILRLAV